ncbi:MAG: ribosome maturation factor RimP [Sulfuricella sp.]
MDLYGLLESTVTGLGYEFVDLEVSQRGKSLRLFIDKPAGISVDDCAFVSNHLSRLLAVEMDCDYDRLEVSSPGLDRVLKKEADFIRFNGERTQIKLRVALAGRKNYAGVLRGVKDGVLQLEVDGALLTLNIADIDKARLIPNI